MLLPSHTGQCHTLHCSAHMTVHNTIDWSLNICNNMNYLNSCFDLLDNDHLKALVHVFADILVAVLQCGIVGECI